MQLAICKRALFAYFAGSGGFAFPDQRGFVRDRGVKMLIEAVVTDIELAADEPLRERLFPLQRGFEWPKPNQLLLRDLRPEFFRSFDGGVVYLFILGQRFDVRALREVL